MNNQTFKTTNLQVVTPEEFIKLYETNKDRIVQSSIIPPKLGKPGFGKIIIEIEDTEDLSDKIFEGSK